MQVDQKDGDESMKFKLRVKGDLHVGGLMLKLVEKISKCFHDKKKTTNTLEIQKSLPCLISHI